MVWTIGEDKNTTGCCADASTECRQKIVEFIYDITLTNNKKLKPDP